MLHPSGVVEDVRDWWRERRIRRRARAAPMPRALRVLDGAHPELGQVFDEDAIDPSPAVAVGLR